MSGQGEDQDKAVWNAEGKERLASWLAPVISAVWEAQLGEFFEARS